MIKTVTITGADDSVNPVELKKLSEEFPFVEWGILVSRKNFGTPRFPSIGWLDHLHQVKDRFPSIKLSCHLCGAYVREFAKGNMIFLDMELTPIWDLFDRVQINFHGEPHEWSAIPIADLIASQPDKEFIFQYDNVNTDLLEVLAQRGLKNISALFDLSHGAGIVPNEWPKHLDFVKCGYAGGLGPDNLKAQISKIESAAGDKEIWIDMETKVRSYSDALFDLAKVRACLIQSIQD
jgi:hypothetical protein